MNRKLKTLDESTKRKCQFCQRDKIDPILYGPLYKYGSIVTHYYCLLLSHRSLQKGADHQGILGFLTPEIKKELKRTKKICCLFCKKPYASLVCGSKACELQFHLPCVLEKRGMPQFKDKYLTFCMEHRPKQELSPAALTQAKNETPKCVVCTEAVGLKNVTETLWAPCCGKAWFHRRCVQQLAYTQGNLFRCSICNDKKKFRPWMVKFGIFIPRKEADWELEPDAYVDLLQKYCKCDAENCSCPAEGGRAENSKTDVNWKIVVCNMCASQGVHVACGNLNWVPGYTWKCSFCTNVLANGDDWGGGDLNEGMSNKRMKRNLQSDLSGASPLKKSKFSVRSDEGTDQDDLNETINESNQSGSSYDLENIVVSERLATELEATVTSDEVELRDSDATQNNFDSNVESDLACGNVNEEDKILFSYFNIGISAASIKSLDKGMTVKPEIMDSFVRKLNSTRNPYEKEEIKICESKVWASIAENKTTFQVIDSNNLESWRNYAKGQLLIPAYLSTNHHPSWGLVLINRTVHKIFEVRYYVPNSVEEEMNFRERYNDCILNFLSAVLQTDKKSLRISCDRSRATKDKNLRADDYDLVVMAILNRVVKRVKAPISAEEVQDLRKKCLDDLKEEWESAKCNPGDLNYPYKPDEKFGCRITGADLNSVKKNNNLTKKIVDCFIQACGEKYFMNIRLSSARFMFGECFYVPVEVDGSVWALLKIFQDETTNCSVCTPYFIHGYDQPSYLGKIEGILKTQPFAGLGEFELNNPVVEFKDFSQITPFDTGVCALYLLERLATVGSICQRKDPEFKLVGEIRHYVFKLIWQYLHPEVIDISDD